MNNIRLYFDEPKHKYTDSLGNEYISTTTLLHNYQPKFKRDYWLRKKAEELHISEKELAKQWKDITDEACKRGSDIHGGLEYGIKEASQFAKAVQYLNNNDGEMITVYDINKININYKLLNIDKFIKRTNNKYEALYNLMRKYVDNGYKLYSEIGVFLPDYLVSGCIDVLCYKEDKFQILDWKTNRDGLQFSSGYYEKDKSVKPHQVTNKWIAKNETLLPPVNHLPNCNGYIYSLQLSMYAKMVEKILSIPCINLCLCHIDCDFELNEYGMPKRFSDGMYHIKDNPVEKLTFYKIPYLSKEIDFILNDRKNNLKATNITRQLSMF